MKKRVTKLKTLQLSWETLRDLDSSETRQVPGGYMAPVSCQSQSPGECCTVLSLNAC